MSKVSSLIIKNVPLWWEILTLGETTHKLGTGVYRISYIIYIYMNDITELPSQFCYEPETALENKILKKEC